MDNAGDLIYELNKSMSGSPIHESIPISAFPNLKSVLLAISYPQTPLSSDSLLQLLSFPSHNSAAPGFTLLSLSLQSMTVSTRISVPSVLVPHVVYLSLSLSNNSSMTILQLLSFPSHNSAAPGLTSLSLSLQSLWQVVVS